MTLILFVMLVASAGAQEQGKVDRKTWPNLVVILADDLGYGDLGCYNPDSKIRRRISIGWPAKGCASLTHMLRPRSAHPRGTDY